MPNRILKESICTSSEIDALTPEEEVFFYRLIVNCDDFGRLDARLPILRAKCFPLRIDQVKDKDIERWLKRLSDKNLLFVYIVDNNPYLQLTTWEKHQQVRAKRSKCPSPDDADEDMQTSDINCNQAQVNVPVIQSNPIQSESESNPNLNPIRIQSAQLKLLAQVVLSNFGRPTLKNAVRERPKRRGPRLNRASSS